MDEVEESLDVMSESAGSARWDAAVGSVRVLFGSGRLGELGELARGKDAKRVLLVSDVGVREAGHLDLAIEILGSARLETTVFLGVEENPSTRHVAAGVEAAASARPDLIIALGGGSVLDCAKAINLLHTNGGRMEDYQGLHRAPQPLLPAIGVPTTAGTGSEAQSYALIGREDTHRKMACGDPQAKFREVILDPDLLATCPQPVVAAAGLDAVAHAVESHVSRPANPISRLYSLAAWRRLVASLDGALEGDRAARGETLVAAHLAGAAIEQSMLGAAHGMANPLTAEFRITHGVALAILLPQVIRFNGEVAAAAYRELARAAGWDSAEPAAVLAAWVEDLRGRAGMPDRLRDLGVERADLARLAAEATDEWTTGNNPRSTTADELMTVYEKAW